MTSKRVGKIVAGLFKWDSEYEVGVWNLTYQVFTGWEILLFLWHYMKEAIFQGYSSQIFNIAAVSRSTDGAENALKESGHAWHLLQNYAAKSPSPFLILRTSVLQCKETVLFSCCCFKKKKKRKQSLKSHLKKWGGKGKDWQPGDFCPGDSSLFSPFPSPSLASLGRIKPRAGLWPLLQYNQSR